MLRINQRGRAGKINTEKNRPKKQSKDHTVAMFINTNVASLNARRNLDKSTGTLSKTFNHLASGLRINQAADDAAGLAVSTRMTAQIRGLNQAQRNANDAISMCQVAEGALDETTNCLQRIRELAVQSSNDTYTSADRASLQKEVIQLLSEIDRIANDTQFNNMNLLNGDMEADRRDPISGIYISPRQMNKRMQVGAYGGQTIPISMNGGTSSDLLATYFYRDNNIYDPDPTVAEDITSADAGVAQNVSNKWEKLPPSYSSGGPGYWDDVVPDGTYWPPDPLIDLTGETIPTDPTGASDLGANPFPGVDNPPLSGTDASARAIAMVDHALNQVSDIRSTLGAIQNRFESAIANLANVSENISSARMRITDADLAEETSKLTKTSILQQAGTAILAQANQQPQLALQLLG